MNEIEVLVKTEALLPEYATEGAAGADLHADIDAEVVLEPGHTCCIPTGLYMAIPEGYELQIRPRSGLALKHGITVLNTPGTIDADYRGNIGVILINHGKKAFVITPQMRIAQAVLASVMRAKFIKTKHLDPSERAEGGFGHTGMECFQTNTGN